MWKIKMSSPVDAESNSRNLEGESPKKITGLYLMAGAGMFLTVGNCLVQYVHKCGKKSVSSFEILFIRSLIQLILSALLLAKRRVSFRCSLKNFTTAVTMGLVEVAAIVFIYLALERMPVGDATVILFTTPVFTSVFSFVCLRRGCSIFDALCGCLNFAGVIVLTHPSAFFNGSNKAVLTENGMFSRPGDTRYLYGIGFALLAAIMLSVFYVLNKIAGKSLDLALTVFYPSLFGVLLCPLFQFIFHQDIYLGNEWRVWTSLVVVGFVCFVGLMFMAEALQLEDAGPAVIIRNLDAVYAFILQDILLKITPSWYTLLGGAIVLLSTSAMALRRTVCSKCSLPFKRRDDENQRLLSNASLNSETSSTQTKVNNEKKVYV